MRHSRPLVLLTLLVVGGVGTALAATSAPAPAGKPQLDTNGDGVIDRQEAAAHPRLAAKFDALDTNKDGKLSREELPRGKGHGRHGRHGGGDTAWKALDTNKDGRISREEAKADPAFAARFSSLDVNGDGYIDREDHKARRTQQRDAWFAAADTNKDGQLSKAEFDAAKPMAGTRGGHRAPRPGSVPAPASK